MELMYGYLKGISPQFVYDTFFVNQPLNQNELSNTVILKRVEEEFVMIRVPTRRTDNVINICQDDYKKFNFNNIGENNTCSPNSRFDKPIPIMNICPTIIGIKTLLLQGWSLHSTSTKINMEEFLETPLTSKTDSQYKAIFDLDQVSNESYILKSDCLKKYDCLKPVDDSSKKLGQSSIKYSNSIIYFDIQDILSHNFSTCIFNCDLLGGGTMPIEIIHDIETSIADILRLVSNGFVMRAMGTINGALVKILTNPTISMFEDKCYFKVSFDDFILLVPLLYFNTSLI